MVGGLGHDNGGVAAGSSEAGASTVGPLTAGLLTAGTLISVFGDQVAAIGLVLAAAGRHSAVLVAAMFAVEFLPGVVLGTWIGRRVDGLAVRKAWVGGLAAQAVSIGVAAAVGSLWLRAVLLAVTACFGVAAGSAGFRALRQLAGEGTGRLNALQGAGRSAGGIAGAAVGGVGLGVLGLRGLLSVDAASFVAFAAVVLAVTPALGDRRASFSAEGRPLRHRRAVELRLLAAPEAFGVPLLGLVVAVAFATSLEGVVGVFYLRDVVRLSTGAYGVAIACWSVGSVAAAAVLARYHRRGRRGTLAPAALVMGAAIAAVAALADPWSIGAVYFAGGAGNGAFNVALANVVHDGVPGEHYGAVWAVLGALLNAAVLVGLLAGAPAAGAPRPMMIVSGVLCMAVAAVAVIARIAMRGGRQPVEEPTTSPPTG